MLYRKLDENDDYVFGHGRADFMRDIPQVPAQAVKTRLRLFTPEWFLDVEEGTPYNTRVLGKYTRSRYEQALKARIIQTEGVLSIDEFSTSENPDTRTLTVTALITTVFGKAIADAIEISMLPLYGR